MGGVRTRALHPRDAAFLRVTRHAIIRFVGASRRVRERSRAYDNAVDLAKDSAADDLYVQQTKRDLELSLSVKANASQGLAEAVLDYYGLSAKEGEEDLETLLSRSLSLVQGGRS